MTSKKKLELEVKVGDDYEERLEVSFRLKRYPDSKDFTSVTDAIGVIKNIFEKYAKEVPTNDGQ